MTIALVSGQTASASGTSSPITATLPSAPTTGNLIVALVIVGTGNSFTTSAVANNHTFSNTTSTPFTGSGTSSKLGIFYLQNVPASSTAACAFTFTGSSTAIIWVAEFSGAATSSVFDKDATAANGGPSTTINTPSITATNTNELLVTTASAGGSISSSGGTGSPWTQISSVITGDASAFVVQTSNTAQGPNFTQSPSSNWDAMSAAFIAASGDVLAASPGKRWM